MIAANLRGTPCRRCGRPLGHCVSGYCDRCRPRVSCPACHAATGRNTYCAACKEAARRSAEALGHMPRDVRRLLDADPARQARIARYAARAMAGLPLFSEA